MPTYVVEAPAGLGKTELVVEHIAESPNAPYEVYVPTHKLAEEWRNRILKVNPHKRVTIIRGRSYTPEDGESFCRKSKLAETLAVAHYPVYPNLCLKKVKGGQQSNRCEHYGRCPYIAQFQNADVYIYPHAYLPLRRTGLEVHRPYGVVIVSARRGHVKLRCDLL